MYSEESYSNLTSIVVRSGVFFLGWDTSVTFTTYSQTSQDKTVGNRKLSFLFLPTKHLKFCSIIIFKKQATWLGSFNLIFHLQKNLRWEYQECSKVLKHFERKSKKKNKKEKVALLIKQVGCLFTSLAL